MSRLNAFIVTADFKGFPQNSAAKHEFFIQPATGKNANWYMVKHSGRLYFQTKAGVKNYLERKGFFNIKGV
jgi:hypothetical protein